jgi:putative Ca2+/H+ antiporter (TMEM165/GDT1 family)
MEAFLISAGAVAVSEIGDKTQLLAIALAARFRQPWPILLAILTATLLNHALAAYIGIWLQRELPHDLLRVALGVSFLLAAAWALKPDRPDAVRTIGRSGVFAVTLVSFFIAEIGDKTQLATVMLAAKYPSLVAVVAGTTTGMLLADAPAVLFGHFVSGRIPMGTIRIAAALVFAALGVVTLLE